MTQTLKINDLAYFDTFAGMIPCKVLAITGKPGFASTAQEVKFQLTADHGAYRKGEILTDNGLHVCPRKSVHVGECGILRILAYTVEV